MPEIVQVGPYRPQLLEPERFELLVENGRIIDANVELGYVNRGIEKLFTAKTYEQNLALAERICGICSGVHTLCYAQTVERILDTTIPERARYLRSIYMELERLHSHFLWFGVIAHSLDEHGIFLRTMSEREQIQDLMEYLTGNRLNYAINTIGGVRRDIDQEKTERIKRVMSNVKTLSNYLTTLLDDNGILARKTRGIGILPKKRVLAIGSVGPTARASGIERDVRRDDPYAAYGELDFEVITEKAGDVHAKGLVRARETFESIGMIGQALDNLPEGETSTRPSEPRIREEIGRAEAPRGELFYYIRSNGTNIPERVKVRTPSYANNMAIIEMLRGEPLENVRTVVESVDPCFACTDRMIVLDVKTGKRRQLVFE